LYKPKLSNECKHLIGRKFVALIQNYQSISILDQELENRNDYLRFQIGEALKKIKKAVRSPFDFVQEDDGKASSNSLRFLSEEEPPKRSKRRQRPLTNSNDFGVEILEFESKLDPDEFVEWLRIVEKIFEYEEVLEDKKVKLVALKLKKYASS